MRRNTGFGFCSRFCGRYLEEIYSCGTAGNGAFPFLFGLDHGERRMNSLLRICAGDYDEPVVIAEDQIAR